MFEKEAEEYANRCACLMEDIPIIERAYRTGAEFGYNKANEWHYPSKGEYPKEREDVSCYCADIKSCSIGHTIIGGDNKIRW